MPTTAIGLPIDTLLTCQQTAEMIGVHTSTLERMRCAGNGPTFIKLGTGKRSPIRYRLSDIQNWLDHQRFQSTSEYGRGM